MPVVSCLAHHQLQRSDTCLQLLCLSFTVDLDEGCLDKVLVEQLVHLFLQVLQKIVEHDAPMV